jgi:hypothetical protein
MSLFVEAQFGENDYATVFGGVKFYFGSDNKSLMRRHREDDPRNQIPELTGFGPTPGMMEKVPEGPTCQGGCPSET